MLPKNISINQCRFAMTRPIATNKAIIIDIDPNIFLFFRLLTQSIKTVDDINANIECPEGKEVKSFLSSGLGSFTIFFPNATIGVEIVIALAYVKYIIGLQVVTATAKGAICNMFTPIVVYLSNFICVFVFPILWKYFNCVLDMFCA